MTTVLLATILSMAGAFVSATQQRDQQAAKSPFAGSWSADLSQSRLDPKMRLKGADITISVTGNVITLASSVVMPSGKTIQKGNQNIALITYEVSTDGQTLTARTSGAIEQVIKFKRSP